MGLRPISANLTWRLPKSEKTLVFWISKSPQSRHPERSASQMGPSTPRHQALGHAINLWALRFRACDFFDLACSSWPESLEEHLPTGIAGVPSATLRTGSSTSRISRP